MLPSNKRAGRKKTLPSIESFCDRWERGDWSTLWANAKASGDKMTNRKSKNAQDGQAQLDAATSAAADGQYGKACRILIWSGIAPNNKGTWEQLKAKHPHATRPTAIREDSEALQLDSSFDMANAFHSFPKDTACGPSGLRVQHILEAQEATVPISLTTQLRHVVNILLRGAAPQSMAPFIAGALLTALNKIGNDIRPIASSEKLRRLTSKCACITLQSKAAAFFTPLQFGVACPGGTEKVTHRLRQTMEKHWNHNDFVVFKVDMSNAFNTIDRSLIMNQCKEHFPELLAWAKFCYGDHPKLWHILGSLSSQHGVQQGDPLGPLFFALGLHSVVKDIDAECQLLLHCWYLDDGVFCGTKSDVTKLLRILNDATPITGLNVKLSPALKEFDKKVRRCYEESVVVNNTQRSWTQAQLPVRLGGVGLRSVEEHSSAAFISSHTSAMGLESDLRLLNDAIEVYNDKIGDNQATYQASDMVRQEPLSERIDRHQFESLIESGSPD